MVDTDITAARLDLTAREISKLQRDLLHRQGDLLALELSTRSLHAGRLDGRAVTDQAEDIRRVFATRYTDDLTGIQHALVWAGVVVDDHAKAEQQAAPHDQDLNRLLNTALRHARRATADVEAVVLAMTPSAQARPGQSGLAGVAERGVVGATQALESARRAVFHLAETLPRIAQCLRGLPADESEQLSLALATDPVDASGRRPRPRAQVERPINQHQTWSEQRHRTGTLNRTCLH